MSWGRGILAFVAGMLIIGFLSYHLFGLGSLSSILDNPWPLLIFMLFSLGLFAIGILLSFLAIVLDYRMARILSLLDRLRNKPMPRNREINRRKDRISRQGR